MTGLWDTVFEGLPGGTFGRFLGSQGGMITIQLATRSGGGTTTGDHGRRLKATEATGATGEKEPTVNKTAKTIWDTTGDHGRRSHGGNGFGLWKCVYPA